MEKQTWDVAVKTSESGDIIITQVDYGDDDEMILLQPEQVDYLCAWLQQAKAEVIERRSKSNG